RWGCPTASRNARAAAAARDRTASAGRALGIRRRPPRRCRRPAIPRRWRQSVRARKRRRRGSGLPPLPGAVWASWPTVPIPPGGPGCKRFSPIVREGNGALRRLSNEEIAKDPQYGDFSLEQAKLGVEDFYDRMDDVMSPAPLDPMRAMMEAIAALDEQVKARV